MSTFKYKNPETNTWEPVATPEGIGAVKKTGDKMTGNLTISKEEPTLWLQNEGANSQTYLQLFENTLGMGCRNDIGSDNNQRTLLIRNSKGSYPALNQSAALMDIVDGNKTIYNLYGEHNKPTPADIGAAATSHASPTTSYGVGDNNNYGHVKLYQTSDCDSYTSEDGACTPAAVKKAVQLFGSAKMTQGPIVIDTTQTLDLTKYGLAIGDQINVICIGGGGGGGGYSYSMYGAPGGDAGKGAPAGSSHGGGGGGGGGYGAGGGGGGSHPDEAPFAGGGGGGSGYIAAKTITLTNTNIAVTIGAGGLGADQPGNESNSNGTAGGTTSFGSYLSAAGGEGGPGGSSAAKAGVGGHNGGVGGGTSGSSRYGGGGGGGGGGWIVENFLTYNGTNGGNGAYGSSSYDANGGKGGDGGSGGGTGGVDGTPGADGGVGHGAVIFWY